MVIFKWLIPNDTRAWVQDWPVNGHKVMQQANSINMIKWINMNHSRTTALDRSVTNNLGELKQVWRGHNPRPCSTAVHIHTLRVVRFAWRTSYSSMHQNSKHTNQDSILRWNRMSTLSTARPTLKYWSNRSPTVEHRRAWPKIGIKTQQTSVKVFRPDPPLSQRAIKDCSKSC